MAQLVARLSGGQEAVGSSPATRTNAKRRFLSTDKNAVFLPYNSEKTVYKLEVKVIYNDYKS